MTPRVLFARIGYMSQYAGPQPGDEKPRHGGAYNQDGVGLEAYNFRKAGGWLYGFVQPYERHDTEITLNLERIDPGAREDSLANVLVVFISLADGRGQVIVGWYENATVFRSYKKATPQMLRQRFSFLMKARASKAVLLPERFRTYPIPTGEGAFGRANVVYPCDEAGRARDLTRGKYEWVGAAVDYIRCYDGPNKLEESLGNVEDRIAEFAEGERTARSGQGFQVDSHTRKQIERHAVSHAERYFRRHYDEVEHVGDTRSYDLICTRGNHVLRVEVKGTQADGSAVILTPNEVANAREHKTALYVLHSIKWRGLGKSRKPFGGSQMVLTPWNIDRDGHLRPLSYTYELKKG